MFVLPCAYVAQKQVEAGREIRVQPGVIAKIPQPQMSQMHAIKMNWKGNRREFFRQNRFWKINFRQPKNKNAMADLSRRNLMKADGNSYPEFILGWTIGAIGV